MLLLPPLSLYIHFPWCVKKCPYCDFNSHTLKNTMPDEAYLSCLIKDLETHVDELQGRQFKSIFLGGGTPSLFPVKTLDKLFQSLFAKDLLTKDCEITLEANPGTIERGYFKDYKKMGINRVSLGAQSFQNEKLHKLGRVHNNSHIYQAVDEIVKSGIKNYNIDLMHGLPNQSVDDALFDLSEAIKLQPTHISWYQLTIEPNTAFDQKKPILPDEIVLESIENKGKSLLKKHQFDQYETSAYTRSENYAKHNLNYWRFGDYIGIGAGAHSKITYPSKNEVKRIWKVKHPKFYLNADNYIAGSQILKKEDLISDFMLNALRLKNGFNYNLFESRTGLSYKVLEDPINKAFELNLLTIDHEHIKPTDRGNLFLNDIINLFI